MSRSLLSLGEIFDIARGGSPRPIDSFLTQDPDGINWIMIGDTPEGSKYITATRKRIRPEGVGRSRKVQPGDFLLTNSMSFGRPYISQIHGCIHDGWLALSPREEICPDFFYHLLGSDSVYAQFVKKAAGATVKNLNIDLVRAVRVAVPPLAEQQRIADILDKTDALRAKRRAALAQLDELTQSVFLEMFGDPVTNPKGWHLSPLDVVAEVQGGIALNGSRTNLPFQVPYLRVANVYRDRLDLREVKAMSVTAAELKRNQLAKDDLLIVEGHGNADEIGRAALWDGSIAPCVHQNHLIRVRFDAHRLVPRFACEFLNSPGGRRHLLRSGKTTSGLNTINVSEVRRTPVAVPPMELQERFVERVASVDQLRGCALVGLAELDALFASLQHRAFNGDL